MRGKLSLQIILQRILRFALTIWDNDENISFFDQKEEIKIVRRNLVIHFQMSITS